MVFPVTMDGAEAFGGEAFLDMATTVEADRVHLLTKITTRTGQWQREEDRLGREHPLETRMDMTSFLFFPPTPTVTTK